MTIRDEVEQCQSSEAIKQLFEGRAYVFNNDAQAKIQEIEHMQNMFNLNDKNVAQLADVLQNIAVYKMEVELDKFPNIKKAFQKAQLGNQDILGEKKSLYKDAVDILKDTDAQKELFEFQQHILNTKILVSDAPFVSPLMKSNFISNLANISNNGSNFLQTAENATLENLGPLQQSNQVIENLNNIAKSFYSDEDLTDEQKKELEFLNDLKNFVEQNKQNPEFAKEYESKFGAGDLLGELKKAMGQAGPSIVKGLDLTNNTAYKKFLLFSKVHQDNLAKFNKEQIEKMVKPDVADPSAEGQIAKLTTSLQNIANTALKIVKMEQPSAAIAVIQAAATNEGIPDAFDAEVLSNNLDKMETATVVEVKTFLAKSISRSNPYGITPGTVADLIQKFEGEKPPIIPLSGKAYERGKKEDGLQKAELPEDPEEIITVGPIPEVAPMITPETPTETFTTAELEQPISMGELSVTAGEFLEAVPTLSDFIRENPSVEKSVLFNKAEELGLSGVLTAETIDPLLTYMSQTITPEQASFAIIQSFISANPDNPEIGKVKRLIKFFEGEEPQPNVLSGRAFNRDAKEATLQKSKTPEAPEKITKVDPSAPTQVAPVHSEAPEPTSLEVETDAMETGEMFVEEINNEDNEVEIEHVNQFREALKFAVQEENPDLVYIIEGLKLSDASEVLKGYPLELAAEQVLEITNGIIASRLEEGVEEIGEKEVKSAFKEALNHIILQQAIPEMLWFAIEEGIEDPAAFQEKLATQLGEEDAEAIAQLITPEKFKEFEILKAGENFAGFQKAITEILPGSDPIPRSDPSSKPKIGPFPRSTFNERRAPWPREKPMGGNVKALKDFFENPPSWVGPTRKTPGKLPKWPEPGEDPLKNWKKGKVWRRGSAEPKPAPEQKSKRKFPGRPPSPGGGGQKPPGGRGTTPPKNNTTPTNKGPIKTAGQPSSGDNTQGLSDAARNALGQNFSYEGVERMGLIALVKHPVSDSLYDSILTDTQRYINGLAANKDGKFIERKVEDFKQQHPGEDAAAYEKALRAQQENMKGFSADGNTQVARGPKAQKIVVKHNGEKILSIKKAKSYHVEGTKYGWILPGLKLKAEKLLAVNFKNLDGKDDATVETAILIATRSLCHPRAKGAISITSRYDKPLDLQLVLKTVQAAKLQGRMIEINHGPTLNALDANPELQAKFNFLMGASPEDLKKPLEFGLRVQPIKSFDLDLQINQSGIPSNPIHPTPSGPAPNLGKGNQFAPTSQQLQNAIKGLRKVPEDQKPANFTKKNSPKL